MGEKKASEGENVTENKRHSLSQPELVSFGSQIVLPLFSSSSISVTWFFKNNQLYKEKYL